MLSLLRYILTTDNCIKGMLIFLFASLVILTVFYKFMKEKHKRIWLFLCTVPFILTVIFSVFNYTKGDILISYQRFIWFPVSALITLLWGIAVYFRRSFKVYTCLAYLLNIACTAGCLYVVMCSTQIFCMGNFSHYGWAESLDKAIDYIEKYYVTADWKEIDFDSLKAELIPRAEIAEQNGDETEFVTVLYDLAYDLYDGHFWIITDHNEAEREYDKINAGNNYGFSMFRDDTGSMIAVMTDKDSEAEKCGIHDGTVITKWDGRPVEEAAAEVRCITTRYTFSYIENEDLVRPIFLAGQGGDSVQVTFIDDSGMEKTLSLSAKGNYMHKLNAALGKFLHGNKMGISNREVCMLDDRCGYLYVNSESADYMGTLEFIKAELSGDYSTVRDEIREKVEDLEKQGMDRMMIALRNNVGGSGRLSQWIASMFIDEPMMSDLGYRLGGKNRTFGKPKKIGNGEWSNIPVVVLVNAETCSSGDVLAYLLSTEDNASLIGDSNTWGCTQAIGGVCYLTNCEFELYFPVIPEFTPDGELLMDAKKDRKARLLLDHKIEYSREEALELFDDSERDIALEKALEYIHTMN